MSWYTAEQYSDNIEANVLPDIDVQPFIEVVSNNLPKHNVSLLSIVHRIMAGWLNLKWRIASGIYVDHIIPMELTIKSYKIAYTDPNAGTKKQMSEQYVLSNCTKRMSNARKTPNIYL